MYNSFRWLTQFTQSPEGKLWDGDGINATGGDTSGTPAAATPAAPATPVATPTFSGSGSAAPAPTHSVPEGYVPSYRLRETREAAVREAQSQWSQKEQQYQAQLQQIQSQLHALVGVQQPANPEVTAVRQQFGQLYPGLSALEERANDLMSIIERANDLESQNSHYWQSYGRQTMDKLFTHAQDSLGAPLTDEGKRQLHSSFVGFVQSSPEMTERYANDPSIVEDFWKTFTSSFIDPVRRTQQAGIQARAGAVTNLPQDTPSGAPRSTPAAAPANADERAAQAWALYNQLKK